MNASNLKTDRGGYFVYKHCLLWSGYPTNETELSKKEVKRLLKVNGGWMLRNVYNFFSDRPDNFFELIKDKPSSLSEHSSKARNQIRRCLRDCIIKRISPLELINDDGYDVFVASYRKYREVTTRIVERGLWEKGVLDQDDGWGEREYWGVYVRNTGKLIAFATNRIVGRKVSYAMLKAIPEFMNKHYPYYGLLFEMNRYYLEECGFNYVSDGWRSVTEHSNIQPFLEKNFLFLKAYCHMKLYYVWWFGLIVRLLYPFRKWIPDQRMKNILKFEEINRE